MDAINLFRRFFGLPFQPRLGTELDDRDGTHVDLRRGDDDGGPFHRGPRGGDRSFDVFSSPLDMERFFNHQMEQMTKSFFGNGQIFGGGHHQFPRSAPELWNFPQGEGPAPKAGSRQFMLKEDSGGSRLSDGDERRDKEVDLSEFNELYVKPHRNDDVAEDGQFTTRLYTFSQSSSGSFRQQPEGTVEERKTVVDNDGVVTTVLTRRSGDRSLTRKCVRQPDGTEECEEASSNLGENDWKEFRPPPPPAQPRVDLGLGGIHPWDEMLKKDKDSYESFFDKFFGP